MRPKTRRNAKPRWDRGFALLAVIVALMIIAIALTVAVPEPMTQAQRERDIEMIYRGEHLAEAIARYYSGGRLSPAGLVVKTPPPPYGYLTELKKLRDGVTVGDDQVYFARASALIDPQTNGEWDPIRIGDPRLRKFFRAWQQSSGRQLPPIYASYLGAGAIVDTTEHPDQGSDTDIKPGTGPDAVEPGNEDDEDMDDEDDEDDEDDNGDEDDEGDGDDGDGDSLNLSKPAPDAASFVNAAYQTEPPVTKPNTNTNTNANTNRRPAQASVFGPQRLGPIIGVVSKKKGPSVVTRFGIERYEEMIFIYFPPQPVGIPGQVQQQPFVPGQQGNVPSNDANGDGIPDNVTPNKPPEQQQQP